MVNNSTTIADLRHLSAADAARLPLDHLSMLLDDVGELKADAKLLGDLLHDALHARYSTPAAALRRSEGKDTGRIRLVEGDFEIVADLPKKIDWHPSRLAEAVTTIRGWGEDPADYVTTEIKVPETRYTAWPPRIRAVFAPARTVATGRPSYTLRRIEA